MQLMTVTKPTAVESLITEPTTFADVLANATALIPFLREGASAAEEARQIPDDTIDALAAAGVFRLTLPKDQGGFEASMTELNEVLAEIARGCPSTGWVATLTTAANWIVGLFPDQAQQEVYDTPGLRAAGVFAPTGTGKRQSDGSVIVNGRWGWNTGSPNAHWAGLGVMIEELDSSVAPQFVLIPYTELDYVDDWYSSGLAGTGSRSTLATDVSVPEHRIVSVENIALGNYPNNSRATSNPYFRQPGVPVFIAGSVGALIGIARGALDVFLERLPGRTITYTDYASQAEAPITHLQVAEAKLILHSAEAHANRASELTDGSVIGDDLTMLDRAAIRGHVGHAAKLARDAVTILFQASGASAIHTSVPIQRYHRDIHSLALHALLQPNTNTELYGRVLLGLPPNTTFL
jgi:alkylation response protein AidB-like acyl-CoA dehydrogenase